MQAIPALKQLFSANRSKDLSCTKTQSDTDPIIFEIKLVLRQLDNLKKRFNYETEYAMIDSCIYEEQALLARYSHLLSVAKQKGITCTYSAGRISSSQNPT